MPDHVEEPGADDRADQRPEHDALHVVVATPHRGAMRPSSHAPIMNPIAMNSPWGEMANESPMRKRSRTGQPICGEGMQHRAASLSGGSAGAQPRGHDARRTARPIRNPLATSLG